MIFIRVVFKLFYFFMGQDNNEIRKNILEKGLFLADEALIFLNERNQKIIRLFFGLEERRQSLASIGKKMGITRERVRQIKTESLKKIEKKLSKNQKEKWSLFLEEIEELFFLRGGFLEESHLGKILKKEISFQEQGKINLLLSLAKESFSFEKKNFKHNNFWILKNKKRTNLIEKKEIVQALSWLMDLFKKENKPMKISEIKKYLGDFSGDFFKGDEGEKRMENLLFLGIKLKKNILNYWGIINWPTIAETITREKAYLVLKKEQKPLHFKQIVDLIREFWPKKKIILQTVHNELIKDQRFALVGRGVYGLCEWGFVKSSVKKLIWDFLKKSQKPLDKKEILQYILEIKKIKSSTISVCLADRRYFQKTKEGAFLPINEGQK